MIENPHARARELMLEQTMGLSSPMDSAWLTRHLAECPDCRKHGESLASTVALLRSPKIVAPPFLAARTRAAVRSHVFELQKLREKRLVVILAVCFDLVWTTMILGLIMGTASWMGYSGDMHWWIVGAFSWFWLLPTIGMTLLLAFRKNEWAPNVMSWSGLPLEGESRD